MMQMQLNMETLLQESKAAFPAMAVLSTAQKNEALGVFADLLAENSAFLIKANQKDLKNAAAEDLAPVLAQRLKLDRGKLVQLIQGIQDLRTLADPVGQILSSTKLDEGLILDKKSVPLGVIGIIFESRPDVIPQIASLILKSGNVVVLKGGREAKYTNEALMAVIDQLNEKCPYLPNAWARLVEGREAVHEMLQYPQYVDLVIPRGSNQLVQSIMASTRIPVLGHADGVCHAYVHASATLESSIPLLIDAKTQAPSACNALETLLVDESIATAFLPRFAEAALAAGCTLRVCDKTQTILPHGTELATDEDWRTEYGDLTLSVKIVQGLTDAMTHINTYGSHHTDAILATAAEAIETFLNGVDSACVFANASTRFADGFRFGLGAEIGISTAKTHARGPVGLEGLVIYKYLLQGQGQIVATYVGENARPFLHEKQ